MFCVHKQVHSEVPALLVESACPHSSMQIGQALVVGPGPPPSPPAAAPRPRASGSLPSADSSLATTSTGAALAASLTSMWALTGPDPLRQVKLDVGGPRLVGNRNETSNRQPTTDNRCVREQSRECPHVDQSWFITTAPYSIVNQTVLSPKFAAEVRQKLAGDVLLAQVPPRERRAGCVEVPVTHVRARTYCIERLRHGDKSSQPSDSFGFHRLSSLEIGLSHP